MRIIAFLLLCVAASCGGERDAKLLRIGLNPWPGYLDLSLAAEQGLFAKHGLNVRIVEFTSLHDMVRSYQLGQIDLMPCTLVEVREAARGRRPAEVVRVFDASEGADVILAHAESSAVEDHPVRIAYEPASLGAYVLQRYLDARGLTAADIEPVPMDQLQMERAMTEHRIDAAVTYPPASLAIASLPGVRQVFSSAEVPGEVIDVLAVDPTVLDEDPSFLARLHEVLADVERFSDDHPDEAVRHKAAHLAVDAGSWDSVVAGVRMYRTRDQSAWLWDSDRLEQLMRSIDAVLARTPGERTAIPTRFHCRHRSRPMVLSS